MIQTIVERTYETAPFDYWPIVITAPDGTNGTGSVYVCPCHLDGHEAAEHLLQFEPVGTEIRIDGGTYRKIYGC